MKTPTLIAIAVVEHDGNFLIGQRPPGAPLSGLWEFPGGKVKSHETPAEAARRECLEETGLEIEVQSEYPREVQLYEHGQVDLRFFACRPLDAQQVRAPLAPFRWTPRKELLRYEFPEGNRRLLEILTAAKGFPADR